MNRRDTINMVFGLLFSLWMVTGPAAVAMAEGEAQGVRAGGPVAAIDAARAAAAAGTQRALKTDAVAGEIVSAPETGTAARQVGSDTAGDPSRSPDVSGGADSAVAAAAPRDTAKPEPPEATSLYDPARHRDPFWGPNLVAPEGVARTPLERYQLGQLKLVGVVWAAEPPRAMVEDSAGLGYIVTAGTAIGSSGGVVRRIESRRVLIEERVTDFFGKKQPREFVMELPEEDRSP